MLFIIKLESGQKHEKLACACSGCIAKEFKSCKFCLDIPRFGGPGKKKRRCSERACCNKSFTTQTNSAASKALKDVTITTLQLAITCHMSIKILKKVIAPLSSLLGTLTCNKHKTDSSHCSAEEVIQVCVREEGLAENT